MTTNGFKHWKFERSSELGTVPMLVQVSLPTTTHFVDMTNQIAVTLQDGRKINGSSDEHSHLRAYLRAVAFAAAAFEDAHGRMKALVVAETKDKKLMIDPLDPAKRSDIPARKRYELDIMRTEYLYVAATEAFLAALDDGLSGNGLAIALIAQASTYMFDQKQRDRDALVN